MQPIDYIIRVDLFHPRNSEMEFFLSLSLYACLFSVPALRARTRIKNVDELLGKWGCSRNVLRRIIKKVFSG